VVKNLTKRVSSREDRFPKTLFALCWYRISEDDGFRDLLSRSQMHVDERDEVASGGAAVEAAKSRCVVVFCGCSYVATSVGKTHLGLQRPVTD
jgi:hypothetical protein